jgi:hypothetical protein
MPHRGCAFRKTSLRNFNGKASGVRTDTGTPSKASASRLNAASVKEAGGLGWVNQQIEVAFLVVVAGQNRSEDARVFQALTTREVAQFRTVGGKGFGWFHHY